MAKSAVRAICGQTSLVFFLGITAGGSVAGSEVDPEPTTPTVEVEGAFDPTAGQTDWSWIGLLAADQLSCPDAEGWIVNAVFSAVQGDGGVEPPPALRRLCEYRWGSEGVVTEDAIELLWKLFFRGDLSLLEKNIAAVLGAGPEDSEPLLEPRMWQPLAQHFSDQAGAVALTIAPGRPPVRLALVDATPTDDQKPWTREARSRHGHALLNMARSLLCEGGECLAQITSRLALRRYIDPSRPDLVITDDVMGGEFGTLVDLARAIQAEVVAWDAAAVPGQKLVINLSVGWDARFTLGSQMPLAEQTVLLAIEDAVCRGAVVIAAVGNEVGGPYGPHSREAWLPGGFEQLAAPGAQECEAALGRALKPDELPPPATTYHPLVHAVSAIRSDGLPVNNHIPKMQPRLAAYGNQAVVESDQPGEPTGVFTGSSIGALLASVSTAAAWGMLPSWHGAEVIDLIHAAGDDVGGGVNLCLPFAPGSGCAPFGSSPDVRRLSLCGAMSAACSQIPGGCPFLPPACPLWKDLDPELPMDLIAAFQQTSPLPVDLDTLDQDYGPLSVCRIVSARYDEDSEPRNICPQWQFRGIASRPWVRPAPTSVPCPPCMGYRNLGTVLIEIDPSFRSSLGDPTLVACGKSYSLPFVPAPGQRVIVEGLDLMGCSSAVLTFTVAGGTSVINSVLIVPGV